MTLSIMRDRLDAKVARLRQEVADGEPYVSEYLRRPLRSLEQARRDIERKERIDDRG